MIFKCHLVAQAVAGEDMRPGSTGCAEDAPELCFPKVQECSALLGMDQRWGCRPFFNMCILGRLYSSRAEGVFCSVWSQHFVSLTSLSRRCFINTLSLPEQPIALLGATPSALSVCLHQGSYITQKSKGIVQPPPSVHCSLWLSGSIDKERKWLSSNLSYRLQDSG